MLNVELIQKNDTEKLEYKLLNNTIFGKTIQNNQKQRYTTCHH